MIGQIFSKLYDFYGDQHWWPAESRFEVMVGAILSQNTRWLNVEKAIARLKNEQALTPEFILATPHEQLAQWIKSSGYYNIKATYLQTFCQWYQAQGGYEALCQLETHILHQQLLSIKGLGNETVDDILLYAFARPVFVVDTYTRRLFSRMGLLGGTESYSEVQHLIEMSLERDTELFAEYHGLIIKHSTLSCKKTPLCDGCPIDSFCIFNKE